MLDVLLRVWLSILWLDNPDGFAQPQWLNSILVGPGELLPEVACRNVEGYGQGVGFFVFVEGAHVRLLLVLLEHVVEGAVPAADCYAIFPRHLLYNNLID